MPDKPTYAELEQRILDLEQADTGREQAEEALQESEEKYRLLHENAGLGIGYYKPNGTIISYNNQAAKNMNGEPDDFAGKSIFKFFPKSEAEFYMERIQKSCLSDQPINYEDNVSLPLGDKCFLSTYSKVTDSNNQILGIQIISQDITERKQAEEALAESDSLRELLLDIITHDLKNPAGVIYALSEAGRQDLPENKFLEAIYTSSGRLIEVLNQTTTLSQAAFGETIPKETLSLNKLLQETVDEFASALSTAEMDLVIATAPVLIIKANPLIAEVFKNYISNAIKYARDGKRIVIESVIENQAVIVRVKDFGKTIAKADREQVFQRQVQLENGKERGRGLGLAIVKRIAAAHDGEVWVEPNTPKGNSFCLRIPR